MSRRTPLGDVTNAGTRDAAPRRNKRRSDEISADDLKAAKNEKRREQYANVSDEVKAERSAKRREYRLRKKAEEQLHDSSETILENQTPVSGRLHAYPSTAISHGVGDQTHGSCGSTLETSTIESDVDNHLVIVTNVMVDTHMRCLVANNLSTITFSKDAIYSSLSALEDVRNGIRNDYRVHESIKVECATRMEQLRKISSVTQPEWREIP
ncbi:unnamed protein product [Urochloa humidicola]